MEILISLDRLLFFTINRVPHVPVMDALALTLSAVGTAGIIWFILGILLLFRKGNKDHVFIIRLAVMGLSTYVLVELILKTFIARLRPTVEMGAIIIGSNVADSFSFPSGHAAISFAAAVALSQKEPKWKGLLYLLAILISLSRIYLGKHYPLDVVAGAALGWLIGRLSLL